MRAMTKAALIAVLLAPVLALAQTSPSLSSQLSYQGRLLKADSTPETGTVQLTFALWDAATAGNQLWTQTLSATLDDKGFYAVLLGGMGAAALPIDKFDGRNLYLGVQVVGDSSELLPRHRLAAVPYAMMATNVKGGSVDATTVTAHSITATSDLTAGTVSATTLATNGVTISDGVVSGATVSATGNVSGGSVTSGNININSTPGLISAPAISGATVTASGNISSTGGAISAPTVTSSGNITAGGNISAAGGTVSAQALSSSGSIAASGNISSTNGTVSAPTFSSSGTITAAGNIKSTSGAVSAPTISSSGTITAAGNISSTSGTVSAPTISGGTITASGNISSSGAVSAASGSFPSLTAPGLVVGVGVCTSYCGGQNCVPTYTCSGWNTTFSGGSVICSSGTARTITFSGNALTLCITQ